MIRRVPNLGIGIGWRPELALFIERQQGLGFIEILAEDFNPWGSIPKSIQHLQDRGISIVLHGVSLSLGGAEPPDRKRLEALEALAVKLGVPFVSEHIAFVRAGGIESGHLLPLPRTQEALDVLVENIQIAQEMLPVPLALENIATLFEWPQPEMDEATFLTEALERTDALLLLDISNLYANARNHGWNSLTFLDRLPLDRLAYVHIAGGIERKGLYHDTHAHAIPCGAIDLLEKLCTRITPPGILLERDDRFPPDAEIISELKAIEEAIK
jgi:hypothetical protein